MARRQTIIWTNAGILLVSNLRNWNSNIFIEENIFENIVCETSISSLAFNVLILRDIP